MNNAAALTHLAWASMPEGTIVKMVAHKCIEKRMRWRRGSKGNLAEFVASFPYVRGDKKKRLDAVIAEIDRQTQIRNTRQTNRPIDWSTFKNLGVDTRRSAVARNYVIAEVVNCRMLAKMMDHLMMTVSHGTYGKFYIYIVRPDRSMVRFETSARLDYDSFPTVLAKVFTPDPVKEALKQGLAVSYDVARLATVVHQRDGSTISYPWKSSED